jgi:predicted amidohydrolase
MNKLKAASVQFNHRPGDKIYNLGVIRKFVESAAVERVELILFPEMCITGYWHVRNLSRLELEELAEPVPAGASTQELKELASDFNITICAGLIEAGPDGKLYNTSVAVMPDGRYAAHRKLHCFINEHMSRGDTYTVFDLPGGVKAGILICYDNNIIENARITSLKGAQILLSPHQTGGCRSLSPRGLKPIDPRLWKNRDKDPGAMEAEIRGPRGRAWLMRWLPSRAHDNGMFLLFSNGIGPDDDEVRTGNAMILDSYGEILSETWKADDDMVTADLDLDELAMCQGQRWLQSRRPDLYSPLTEFTGRERDTREVHFSE